MPPAPTEGTPRSSTSSTTASTDPSRGPPVPRVPITISGVHVEGLPTPDGLPDPWVSLRVGTNLQATAVRPQCARAEWEEAFTFQVGPPDLLYITVWDEGAMTNVGEAWLDVDRLLRQGGTPAGSGLAAVTVSLEGPTGPAGTAAFAVAGLTALAALLPGLPPAPPPSVPSRPPPRPPPAVVPPVAPGPIPMPPPPDGQPHTFVVTVVRAQALQTLLPCPNAYVVIRDGTTTRHTTVQPQCNDPVWDQAFHCRLAPTGELQVELRHNDCLEGLSLATVRLAAHEIPARTGPFGLKYTLRGPSGAGSGVLLLRFEPAAASSAGPDGPPSPPAPRLPEGRRVAPVVRVSGAPEPTYQPIDINSSCPHPCPAASEVPPAPRLTLADPAGPCSLRLGVLAGLLPRWIHRRVFVAVRCGAQYHKTAAKALNQDEVVWDDAFFLTMAPTEVVVVALRETDGAGVEDLGSATVTRATLTSMIPYHELWVPLTTSRGDSVGELLLAVTSGQAQPPSERRVEKSTSASVTVVG